jgi:hypothetical protein
MKNNPHSKYPIFKQGNALAETASLKNAISDC